MSPFRTAAVVEPQPLLTPDEEKAARIVGLTNQQYADALASVSNAPPRFRESFFRMAVLDARTELLDARTELLMARLKEVDVKTQKKAEKAQEPPPFDKVCAIAFCIGAIYLIVYFIVTALLGGSS